MKVLDYSVLPLKKETNFNLPKFLWFLSSLIAIYALRFWGLMHHLLHTSEVLNAKCMRNFLKLLLMCHLSIGLWNWISFIGLAMSCIMSWINPPTVVISWKNHLSINFMKLYWTANLIKYNLGRNMSSGEKIGHSFIFCAWELNLTWAC